MWDASWETIFKEKAWGKYPGEDVIRFIARNYYGTENRSEVKILEVGSGAGANLWFLAREGFCFCGIEGASTAVEQSISRLNLDVPGWRDVGSEVLVGDCVDLPCPDNNFDSVIDIGAISCNSFEDSKRIYAELLRVAKPGGRLLSRVLAGGCWGDGTGVPSGRRAFMNCTEGPLAGLGLIRFTDESDVAELLGGWRIDSVERLMWTEDDRGHEIRHLMIYARKQ